MLNNAHGGLDSFKEMVNFAIFPSAGLHSLGFLPSCVGEWTLLELLLSHSRCPEPRQNAQRSFYIATSTITIYAPSLFRFSLHDWCDKRKKDCLLFVVCLFFF